MRLIKIRNGILGDIRLCMVFCIVNLFKKVFNDDFLFGIFDEEYLRLWSIEPQAWRLHLFCHRKNNFSSVFSNILALISSAWNGGYASSEAATFLFQLKYPFPTLSLSDVFSVIRYPLVNLIWGFLGIAAESKYCI